MSDVLDPLSQTHILAEVKPGYVALSGDLFSLTMAADFYEVSTNTLKRVLSRHAGTLHRDGMRYLTRDEAVQLLSSSPGARLATNQQARILTPRCMLRLGLLLKTSAVARQVAKRLGQIPRGREGFRLSEQETLSVIVAAVQPLTAQMQRSVGPYRLDLYLPDLRLAVECDEAGHAMRSAMEEQEREQFVSAVLGCRFLRFNPDAPTFSLGGVINSILTTHGGAQVISRVNG